MANCKVFKGLVVKWLEMQAYTSAIHLWPMLLYRPVLSDWWIFTGGYSSHYDPQFWHLHLCHVIKVWGLCQDHDHGQDQWQYTESGYKCHVLMKNRTPKYMTSCRKKWATLITAITLSILDQLAKFFCCCKDW